MPTRRIRPHGDTHERIRLMQCMTTSGVRGPVQKFVTLGRALDPRRFALEYACLDRWGGLPADVGLKISEYSVHSMRGGRALWQWLRLARRMSQQRVQVVHTHDFRAAVFAIPAAWLAGAAVAIASIGDVQLNAFERRVQRQACRLADCVVVNADSMKDWLIDEGYDAERIVVIRDGVDVSRARARSGANLRAELGIPKDAPVVAMISPAIVMAGVEDFVDAAAFISWYRPDVRFLIVDQRRSADCGVAANETLDSRTIVDRIARLGLTDRVSLTSAPSAAPALAEACIAVHPSRRGGLPDALLESMAARVPVVATRVGGHAETIENGVTGLLVPPGDPQTLADAIGRLLDDGALSARLGRGGREAVVNRFSLEQEAHATERIYLDLLVHKAARPDWRQRIGLAPPVIAALAQKRS